MVIAALLFPLPLLAMIFVLAWIEEKVLTMGERELEEKIAEYLEPVVRLNSN